jgi:hypothetical protein
MPTPNQALAGLLAELGWSPRTLARQINRVFGEGTVSTTAPYYWRDDGGIPHPPLPDLAAYVLSQELGRQISVSFLWQGRVAESPGFQLASAGMDRPWKRGSSQLLAEEWVRSGLVDRRVFLAVSGAALARSVWAYLTQQNGTATSATPIPAGVGDPLLQQITSSIPLLQQLDDAHGGAAHLAYVGAQVRAVALVLKEGQHRGAAERQLLIALADLCQLAGWKALDANLHGLAQRYLFTGLRAAYDADYTVMAAHILADLAVQAVIRDNGADAVVLGEAAARCAHRTPAGVQACVASRLAHAYAATGRISEFDRVRHQAREFLQQRAPNDEPAWLYYLTPGHLDSQAGYSLILLGRRQHAVGDRSARSLLRTGEALLRGGAYDRPLTDSSQRRALYEGAWLALGYTAHGKLEEACHVTRTVLARLAQVKSPRSMALLKQLTTDLRRRRKNPAVAELWPDLHAAVS